MKRTLTVAALVLLAVSAHAGEVRYMPGLACATVAGGCTKQTSQFDVNDCVDAQDPVPCCTAENEGTCPPVTLMCCAPGQEFYCERTIGPWVDGSQDVTGYVTWQTCHSTGCAAGAGTEGSETACLTVSNSVCVDGDACNELLPGELVEVTLDEDDTTAGIAITHAIGAFRYDLSGGDATLCGTSDCDNARVTVRFAREEGAVCTADDLTELACFSIVGLTEPE